MSGPGDAAEVLTEADELRIELDRLNADIAGLAEVRKRAGARGILDAEVLRLRVEAVKARTLVEIHERLTELAGMFDEGSAKVTAYRVRE